MTSAFRIPWLLALPFATVVASPGWAKVAPDKPRLNPVHSRYPAPPNGETDALEAAGFDDDLSTAIAEAYATNPALAARRYDLRATDDALGVALSRTRASVSVQASSGYDLTLPGAITQATRSLSDRLNNPNIERNDVTTQIAIDQPVWTGGRAHAETRAARADIAAGREGLRGAEGDLILDLIAAYADVRRDGKALSIRERNVAVLKKTLDEVVARREAGELTRTDIAQAETQLHAAEVQRTTAEAQLEASRSTFANLVGRPPRRLAPEPPLPSPPASIDAAFVAAERSNPELSAAAATERASRERIAGAMAEGNPSIALRGTAGTFGPVSPLDRRDQDVSFSGRATLTVPLLNGGRVQALVAQARNRNQADAARIETVRRQIADGVTVAWNAWAAANRNIESQSVQLQAARIYYDGTFEEYREGLRSTFDVLFAQNQLREVEIALVGSRRDAYVAEATLLRRIGQLDTARLLTATNLYDPSEYTRKVERRGALPWDPVFRAADAIGAPAVRADFRPPLVLLARDPRFARSSQTAEPAIEPARGDAAMRQERLSNEAGPP